MKDNTSWSCSCFSVKLCLLSLLFLTETLVAIKLPPNLKFPALIAFGDSIVDTGNNNNVKTVVKSDFQPYGINFQGGVPTGRFCDGRVPTDLIAEELGIKSVVPAYLDPSLKTEDILTGVSFASGGSGYDPLTPKLVAVISLEEQLKYFEEYIEKVKNIVGEERKGFILANSLFLLVAGSDDIANTYYVLRARPNYDADSYTTLMANSATDFVNKLYGYGVRRIAVFGAPPLGCVPSQRTLGGGLLRECAENYNEAAKLFNSKISAKLDLLHKTLPGIKPVYINIYDPLLNIIQSPAKYGFEVSNKGCCGTGLVEVAVLCNKITSSVCSDLSSHVFWDNFSVYVIINIIFSPLLICSNTLIYSLHALFYNLFITRKKRTKAEEFGIKSLVPAYLDPSLKPEDLLTGVSFASGGSGYDPLTPKLVAVISLEEQLKYFEEYIEKVKNIVGDERKDFILANSLFLLVAGSNDIANTYYVLRARPQYDVDSYTTLMANSTTDIVNKLYGYGVRRIAVFGAPPLGCLPSQRTLAGGLLRECAENYNEAAKLFNSKISKKLDLLHKTLPGIKPVYTNVYDPLLDIIQNPAKYGFGVSNKGCCGTGLIEVGPLCNKITASVCPDLSSRVFWDSYHPTEKTYKVVVSLLISKLVNKFV
ncbi:GDSL esterase/lipase EXL3 [Raphanus sativus]|nr:GDSL esterase/lipase EXL3 [Raphanus sativus]